MADAITLPAATPPSVTEWLGRIGIARRQGNHLEAFDLARRALNDWPDSLHCAHQAILALARAGALEGAMQRYNKLLAVGRLDDIPDANLAADFAGLSGRLFKDLAARHPEPAASQYRLASAKAYEAGFERFGAYYLAINAASMFLAAGYLEQAIDYARIAHRAAANDPPDYWTTATQAEASLILGNFADARESLAAASSFGAGNLDNLATTRRQLTWVAALVKAPVDLLDHLPGPLVLNWSSGGIANPETIKFEFSVGPGVLAFGPLLSPSDLYLAKALLDAGAILELVLPNAPDNLAVQTFSSNPELRALVDHVLAHERTRQMRVTDQGAPLEPAASLLCARQARGLALLRAQSLAVTPQLLVPGAGGAIYQSMPKDHPDLTEAAFEHDVPADRRRQSHAILFGDVHGFSALTEFQQLEFLEHIIGGFAEVLSNTPSAEYAETAGDGLFIVLSELIEAVECAFALHAVLPKGAAAGGLPPNLGMRISAHVGPLYKRLDRVINREKFCGMEVIRTARIEPVTPVGEIYVTEQFAAVLACAAGDAFVCEYVGLQPMAKGYGECRMYSLRRAMHGDLKRLDSSLSGP